MSNYTSRSLTAPLESYFPLVNQQKYYIDIRFNKAILSLGIFSHTAIAAIATQIE